MKAFTFLQPKMIIDLIYILNILLRNATWSDQKDIYK